MSVSTLYYTRCAVPTPLGIAARLGWLREEFEPDAIAIAAVVDSESEARREAHYDHSVENLFRLGGSIPALWARSKGTLTRLLALSWVDEFQGIVVLPDAGIAKARDLRGRRFGLARHASEFVDHTHASSLRGVYSALRTEGLTLDDVQLVEFAEPRNSISQQGEARVSGSRFSGPRRQAANLPLLALLRREVDAIYLKGPRGLQLVHQLGLHVAVDLGSHPDPLIRANNCTPRTLTVDQQLLEQRPDLVTRAVRRVQAVGDWAALHADEAVRFIGDETATASAWVKYGHGSDVHLHLGIDLAPQALAALADLKDFLVTRGYLPHDFSVEEWAAPQILQAAGTPAQRRVA
jgi:ABC-type nitrate/sulfonate/bicarbonate transport system substrate-binding protein